MKERFCTSVCVITAVTLSFVGLASSAVAQTARRAAVDPSVENIPGAIDLETAISTGQVQRLPAPDSPPIEKALDGRDDPGGLLGEEDLGSLKGLARRLSTDRSWLREEILIGLDFQGLRLDEVFANAPELVEFNGELYRVQLEKIGGLWDEFDPQLDDYFVYLTQEVFDGWGEDRALGFHGGREIQVFESDFEELPALGISLGDVARRENIGGVHRIVSLASSLDLGPAGLKLAEERVPSELRTHRRARNAVAFNGLDLNTTCTQEVAPTSCSNGRPVCGVGYSPYFVLDQVLIKTDHEGFLKGSPEIELFPLRVDLASTLYSNTRAETDLWFYGQSVTDMAGRTRYLPDVNNTNIWYSVTNGLALFPANMATEFSALLVEQDDDRGVLRVDQDRINQTELLLGGGGANTTEIEIDRRTINSSWLFIFNFLVDFMDIIGLFNDGDDLYQESLGVGNSLFCADSIGQMKSYTLDSQEWAMRGHFACINPSCPNPSTGGGGGGGGGGGEFPSCLFTTEPTINCP